MVEGHTWTSSAVLLAVTVCLGAGCAARTPAALPPPAEPDRLDRWERVLALTPGADLRIRCRSGAVVRGRFRSADDEAVVVTDGAAELETPRADVRTLATIGRRAGDFTLRGLLAGAAFGGLVAAASRGSSDALSILVVPWFGGLGAGAGAVLGLTPLESLVYEAPKPVPRESAPFYGADSRPPFYGADSWHGGSRRRRTWASRAAADVSSGAAPSRITSAKRRVRST